jgi:hypothetical protein
MIFERWIAALVELETPTYRGREETGRFWQEMARAEEKLKGKQAAALTALLSQPTVADAAKAAKIGERTLWRYLSEETFAEAYREAKRELVGHTIMRLQANASAAAKVLMDVASNTEQPASARVAAARVIIDHALNGAKLNDLQSEMDEIKRMLATRETEAGCS